MSGSTLRAVILNGTVVTALLSPIPRATVPSRSSYPHLTDMFSQWRHALESVAQSPRSSQDASAEDTAARASGDSIRPSLSSSSQLAESALSNLKKTLVSQRPASPSPSSSPAQAASPPAPETTTTPAPKPRAGRTTLEDRLRAKFALGDASGNSTPAPSTRTSPSPVPAADHPLAVASEEHDIPVVKGPPNPLSPTSAPLPDSPLVSPTVTEPALSLHVASESISELPKLSESPSPQSSDGPETATPDEPNAGAVDNTVVAPSEVTSDSAQPESPAVQASEEITRPEETVDESAEVAGSPPPPVTQEEPSALPDASSPELQIDALPSTNEESAHDTTADPSGEPASTLAEPLVHSEAVHDEVSNLKDEVVPNGDVLTDVPPSTGDAPCADPDATVSNGKAVDVESLQKRLKLVEQRFTGT